MTVMVMMIYITRNNGGLVQHGHRMLGYSIKRKTYVMDKYATYKDKAKLESFLRTTYIPLRREAPLAAMFELGMLRFAQ